MIFFLNRRLPSGAETVLWLGKIWQGDMLRGCWIELEKQNKTKVRLQERPEEEDKFLRIRKKKKI